MSLTGTLQYKWPPFTLQFFAWARLFTFDVMALPFVGCLSRSSFVNAFFMTIIGPPAVIVAFIVLYIIGLMSKFEVWRNSIYLCFLIYPKTCETIVNAFRCYSLRDGRQYLLEDFNIPCDAAYKAFMWPAAFAALAVYAGGVPLIFYRRLRLHRCGAHCFVRLAR